MIVIVRNRGNTIPVSRNGRSEW